MQAVILAAGKSTRTYPITVSKPKPLLKVCGKTLLEHNLGELQGIVDEVIIIIGFKGDLIKERIGDTFGKIKVRYVEQKEICGSGFALLSAKDHLTGKFIVMNGDDFFSGKDIARCVKNDYCILGKEMEDLSKYGTIKAKDGRVFEIIEKQKTQKMGFANTGLYVFDKSIFAYQLKKSQRGEYEIIDYVTSLIKDRKIVSFVEVKDYWIPIGYPWDLLAASEYLLAKFKGKNNGTVEKGATLKGEVYVAKGSLVKAGSYIEGPAYIGEDCTIGPNCFIRKGVSLGNSCKIGNAVELKNSIVGDNTAIGHLSYVGDSVIGDNVNFGAGTITANLRHDDKTILTPVKGVMIDTGRRKLGAIIGDHVHTGINTSIYPGRKIWPEGFTRPGQIVDKDIE